MTSVPTENFLARMAQVMQANFGSPITVTLLATERYTVPLYAHLWQGWSVRRVWDWKRSGKPLSALLRPQRQLFRQVPTKHSAAVEVRRKGHCLILDDAYLGKTGGGSFTMARLTSANGIHIADVELTHPLHTAPDGQDSVTLTNIMIGFS